MSDQELTFIFSRFQTDAQVSSVVPIKDGLINHTYAVSVNGEKSPLYLMQNVNTSVFKKPDELMANIKGVCSHIRRKIELAGGDPMRETLTIIPTIDGKDYYSDETVGVWRLYYYISDSKAHQSADIAGILHTAAESFGHFQKLLSDYPAETLYETIPNFHNTVSRYEDYMRAVNEDKMGRVAECKLEIEQIAAHEPYAHRIVDALAKGEIPLRVTHNDTKLNNIMIDNKTGKGLCVIDLDTVMPGSLLYDFGDSIRFAASNAAEDEADLGKVFLRLDLFKEYTDGFLAGVGNNITDKEVEMLPLSAFVLTYELVLRFLGDYLNGDVYFQIHSAKHNLIRARAQLKLALDIETKFSQMAEIVRQCRS